MKTYREYLNETDEEVLFQRALHESVDLTPEQEEAIDQVVERILAENAKGRDLSEVMEEITNEGIIGSILGGLTGFALGKSIGKTIDPTSTSSYEITDEDDAIDFLMAFNDQGIEISDTNISA